MSLKVRTRFAPSPTGYLHVGSLRTALYAYLVAKKNKGQFLLRVEDTDRERFVEGSMEDFLRALSWSGINPDEGVCFEKENIIQKGNYGPYIQSERLEIYKKYSDQLIKDGHAYKCFCTKERLDSVREELQKKGCVPKYDRHCLGLSKDDINKNVSEGRSFVVRLKIPEGITTFKDEIRGDISYPNKDLDDQVLIKSDGFPTYHMAVVIDDHEMQISHVIRGDEWISSTPKHIILYNAFGWNIPVHAHLPLLLNEDRTKLSKRQGDVAVNDYINKGYLPEALINFVAFLGWNPGDEREIFSLSDLVENFSLDKVGKSGAFFNIEKLDWYNKEYLKKLDKTDFINGIKKFSQIEGIKNFNEDMLVRISDILKERISKYQDIDTMMGEGELQYFFDKPILEKNKIPNKNCDVEKTSEHLSSIIDMLSNMMSDWNPENIKGSLWDYAGEKGRGDVLWPLRYSLSGKNKSPDPFTLAYIFGKDETISRIKNAISILNS